MSNADSRNILAWGQENQDKLSSSRVAVIGSDTLGQIVLASLAGLGVGYSDMNGALIGVSNSRYKRGERDILVPDRVAITGAEKVYLFEHALSQIKSRCNYVPQFSYFSAGLVKQHEPNIIIDATNDPDSKKMAIEYCIQVGVPMISVSCSREKGNLTVYNPEFENVLGRRILNRRINFESLLHRECSEEKQFAHTGNVVSGLALEELRKLHFQYGEGDGNLENLISFHYNPYSENRRDFENSMQPSFVYNYSHKKVLIVGGGALGNFVAMGLADNGVGNIDILDFDVAEGHNLNRQFLLYDGVGEYKCITLARRVKEIDDRINVRSFKSKIGRVDPIDKIWLEKLYGAEVMRLKRLGQEENIPDSVEEMVSQRYTLSESDKRAGISQFNVGRLVTEKYDLIIGCVDNKFARMWLNEKAVQNGIPYIDGGTGAKSGQLAVYAPGKYSCVDCQVGLKKFPARYGCLEAPQGSVVMSNSIIGGMMVAEARKVFNHQYEGRNSLQIVYRTDFDNRISLMRDQKEKFPHCY